MGQLCGAGRDREKDCNCFVCQANDVDLISQRWQRFWPRADFIIKSEKRLSDFQTNKSTYLTLPFPFTLDTPLPHRNMCQKFAFEVIKSNLNSASNSGKKIKKKKLIKAAKANGGKLF